MDNKKEAGASMENNASKMRLKNKQKIIWQQKMKM